MAVVFIDGFDLHTASGNGLAGARDPDRYWYTPPLSEQGYAAGDQFGQAIHLSIGPWHGLRGRNQPENGIPAGVSQVRAYARIRRVGSPSGTSGPYSGLMYIRWGGFDIGIQHRSTLPGLRLAYGGFHPGLPILAPSDDTIEVIDAVGGISVGLDYDTYELFIDATAGIAQAFVNGDLILEGELPVALPVGPSPTLMFNRPASTTAQGGGQTYTLHVDHVVVTDGERLAPGTVHAIAPTAAMDRYETSRGGFQGVLAIGNLNYKSVGASTSISSHPGSVGNNNAENIVYYLFNRNPATTAPWSGDPFNEISGWGVCGWRLQPGSGNRVRLSSLFLSIVETDSTGTPRIRIVRPAYLTNFCGSWEMSDPQVSLPHHLADAPRQNPFEGSNYLLTDDLGCIVFGRDTGAWILDTYGVAFAEEFRVDFTDWVRVNGLGVPYESSLISGYNVLAEGNKKFQSNYVTVNYENVPVGGAYLQAVWDYTVDPNTGRWGTRQQIYYPKPGYKHQSRKLKTRGHGTSIQMRITSYPRRDFRINGWSMLASSNTAV